MSIKILQPGLFTTIQDEGRIGYQDLGFSGAGTRPIQFESRTNTYWQRRSSN